MKKEEPRVIAVIPARGGSKSIPGKNIKLFNGHPLIAYSIAAGLKAKMVERVIVSTDDPRIAAVARYYGAEIPFLRPHELAMDGTPDFPVYAHVLEWLYEKQGYCPDIIVQLRPTSPLRPQGCVDDAIRILLRNPRADSVRGVTLAGQNPYKMWYLRKKFLTPIVKSKIYEAYNAPRQKLPKVFWQTGHIDAVRISTISKKHSLSGKFIAPLYIDHVYASDLDTLVDWKFAEWVLSQENLPVIRPDVAPYFFRGIRLLVLDFDGVFTDNRVYITDSGKEAVKCSRSDGMGLSMLKELGIRIIVLSSEVNPVVSARCRKLKLRCFQGLKDKAIFFKNIMSEEGCSANQTVYLGNDKNDIGCMRLAGCSAVVSDAHPEAIKAADFVLSKPGGKGAIRELCDLIISCSRKGR